VRYQAAPHPEGIARYNVPLTKARRMYCAGKENFYYLTLLIMFAVIHILQIQYAKVFTS
jgi:hypothetical protein